MPSLKLAVVLFDRANFLDFLGPVEQFGFLQQSRSSTDIGTDRVTLSIEYLGPTRNPVKPVRGPAVLVDRAYNEVEEDERFDILLIPGGMWGIHHDMIVAIYASKALYFSLTDGNVLRNQRNGGPTQYTTAGPH